MGLYTGTLTIAYERSRGIFVLKDGTPGHDVVGSRQDVFITLAEHKQQSTLRHSASRGPCGVSRYHRDDSSHAIEYPHFLSGLNGINSRDGVMPVRCLPLGWGSKDPGPGDKCQS